MKTFWLPMLCCLFLTARPAYSADDHGHAHDHGDHGHEEETMSAEDYVGFSMEVPKKTQDLIGLKTAEIEESAAASVIPVTGRIAQDVETVFDVMTPKSGTLKDCGSGLGASVAKGDTVCRITTEDGQTLAVTAPASGVVIAAYVKSGDAVDPVSPLMTIADLTELPANFDIQEKDVGRVHTGQQVRVFASAYPDKAFAGSIVFVSPRVDETTFTVKIRVAIDNTELLLKPGMFVRGEILIKGDGTHLSVPSDAVQNLDGMPVVFLQEEAESFVPTEVEIRFASRKNTIVDGDFRAGDRVVSEGAFILKSKILESEIVGGCAHGH